MISTKHDGADGAAAEDTFILSERVEKILLGSVLAVLAFVQVGSVACLIVNIVDVIIWAYPAQTFEGSYHAWRETSPLTAIQDWIFYLAVFMPFVALLSFFIGLLAAAVAWLLWRTP